MERSRTGGSGWGAVIRLPNEDAYEKHLALKWDELADSGLGTNPALSPDGKRALIYVRSEHRWHDIDIETGKFKAPPAAGESKKKKSK